MGMNLDAQIKPNQVEGDLSNRESSFAYVPLSPSNSARDPDSPMRENFVDMDDAGSYYGISQRTVAVESCEFVLYVMRTVAPRIKQLLPARYVSGMPCGYGLL